MIGETLSKFVNVEALNAAGDTLGYGTCPNCGDSWHWKSHRAISYDSSNGVMICLACLAEPHLLNPGNIMEELLASGWLPAEAQLAATAVEGFKAKNAAIRNKEE